MTDTIRTIIIEIPRGYCFDAHMIITKLIEENSDLYLNNFTNGTTHSYHGRIAQSISQFEGELVEKQESDSWSKNMHNNYSNCSLWKRI